ncbi:hypothetical protein T11_13979 [Trichinella zimbabwensis]|uniref:Uncharacterized protein n=1 Tax=Trichinella zimbabwensis TaxID=268475 RepID=A0A0V1I726_9BILA|nr:hypothetical protein T11_13979 [Trichinella zimbabwensis]
MASIRFLVQTMPNACASILNIVFHGSSIPARNIEIKPIGYDAIQAPGFAGCQQSNVISCHKHQDVHGFTLVQ